MGPEAIVDMEIDMGGGDDMEIEQAAAAVRQPAPVYLPELRHRIQARAAAVEAVPVRAPPIDAAPLEPVNKNNLRL